MPRLMFVEDEQALTDTLIRFLAKRVLMYTSHEAALKLLKMQPAFHQM